MIDTQFVVHFCDDKTIVFWQISALLQFNVFSTFLLAALKYTETRCSKVGLQPRSRFRPKNISQFCIILILS